LTKEYVLLFELFDEKPDFPAEVLKPSRAARLQKAVVAVNAAKE
jgi:hypothetical protein